MTKTERRHGTNVKYVQDKCRCEHCVAANTAYERRRSRLTAYGQWQPYVDAQPAREHVQALMEYGIGYKRIAQLAGLPVSSVSALVYGKSLSGGKPNRFVMRIRPSTEAKILAVQPSLDLLGDTVPVNSTGTRRRLQALVANGWSVSRLGAELGMLPSNIHKTIKSPMVRAATARAVMDLYERLWDQAPPQNTPAERIAASRARNYARVRKWAPPMAWDDADLDDPQARPFGHTGRQHTVAAVEDIAWLSDQGETVDGLSARLGIDREALYRRLHRHGRLDVWRKLTINQEVSA